MADDDYSYLQPDFDPASLTVPRLRSILVAHNVAYPSSAKKSDLVGIFNQNVAPQARKLLNAQSRTTRSTRGIVDVPSSQGSTADSDDDHDVAENITVSATTPAKRSVRRSTVRPAVEEAIAPTPRSTRRRVVEEPIAPTPRTSRASFATSTSRSRRPSSRHATVEQETPRQVPKPAFRSEPPEVVYRPEDVESPFTQDNPFQSGSSPPSVYRNKSGDRRRTTMGVSADRERRKSREPRRRTEGWGRRDNDEMPVARVKVEPDTDDDVVMAGEEFTPEEQTNLVKAQERGSTTTVVPRRRPRSGAAKAAPWTVMFTMLAGVAAVWRQEKLQVGYCGVGEPSASFGGVQIPDWASFVQPQCEPCPQHAECLPNLETRCDKGFVLSHHPLSLNGLVPLPPTCEPDSEKVHKIRALTNYAVETELRTRNAQYECGEVATPDISEPELKETVSKRARRMTDEEFDELWGPAMDEIVGREEVTTKVEEQSSVRILRSTSLAKVPLRCAIRRSIRLTLRQHLRTLVGVIVLSLSAVYGNYALVKRRSTSKSAKHLAGLALDKLATQASLHASDPVGYPEPLISMVALRDDVLRDEFRAKERNRLWTAVQKLVEGNANVRTMVREGRTGDVSRMWEWIGAVHRIEGINSNRSTPAVGRIAGSPSGRLLDSSVDESLMSGDGSALERRKWEEQRPYY